jgi:peptide deformylase
VLFDPLIVDSKGKEIGREGCMSVPDLTANVLRATEIVVRGRGAGGEDLVIATEGFEARALQHEVDHLDGYLILDRVASLATDVFKRKVYRT